MQTTDKEQEAQLPYTPADPQSKPLMPVHVPQVDISDDAPDEIFLKAVAEIDTQPLPRRKVALRWQDILQVTFCLCMIVGGFIGVLWAAINYPKTTVTLFPVERSMNITTAPAVPLRTLAPITLTRSAAAPTTGHGHQDARRATGTIVFYNGQSNPQTIARGTVFTGNDGVKVTTDQTVSAPAANLPTIGEITVSARAIIPGSQGNIAPYDINVALSSDLKVKNEASFAHGRDARDYRAVAQSDLDTVTSTIRKTLSQAFAAAFPLRPGEALVPTNCRSVTTTTHQTGDEAQSVSVTIAQTCQAIAYNQTLLETQATVAFTTGARLAPLYQLLGSVQTSVTSVTPFQVKVTGTWVYVITSTYEQDLAEKISGDTPAQARAYLLKTGVISQATVPSTLPQAMYIRFLVLWG